jgi:DNA-directed RNA polymerase subunit M/transcription elongation factor TFIIS
MTTKIESFREIGKDALKCSLSNEKNIAVLEKNIYEVVKSKFPDDDNNKLKENYFTYIYEILGDIDDDKKLSEVLANIKTQKIGWLHPSLSKLCDDEFEQDSFIIKPFEVAEGIAICKCGSKRVYSYSKQCRSNDEPISTFNECLECKSKWMHN